MRLLDTDTGHFVEKDPKTTKYAILSHTWNHEGEQTYHELRNIQGLYLPNCSSQVLPVRGRRPIPLSSSSTPLDASLGGSSASQSSCDTTVTSERIPNERTPLLRVPDSHDLMEQGLAPGNHHQMPLFGPLRLLIIRFFQCVWRFLVLLACGFPRRPAEPTSVECNPSPSPSSTHAPLQSDVRVTPNLPARSLSQSESLLVVPAPPEREPPQGRKSETPPLSILHDPELAPKIREACAVARAHGFRFIWIDSCCLDRSNDSELSSAINSIYFWYASAAMCYAYLADVPTEDDQEAQASHFSESRWFTRGWTLPELIAPKNVTFLYQDWQVIGSKSTLADLVEEITGVTREAFLHARPLSQFSVAQRLSWASRRETMLVEDEAYSLLGIFGLDMPIMYGEGEGAFRRLQEEILQRVLDHSIFAWGDLYLGPDPGMLSTSPGDAAKQEIFVCRKYDDPDYQSLLATSPSTIEDSARNISAASHDVLRRLELSHHDALECAPSPRGIRMQFQMIPLSQYLPPRSIRYESPEMARWEWYLAILACAHEDHPGSVLGRVCYVPPSDESGLKILRPGYVYMSPRPERGDGSPDLFVLAPETIERCRAHVVTKTVYV